MANAKLWRADKEPLREQELLPALPAAPLLAVLDST